MNNIEILRDKRDVNKVNFENVIFVYRTIYNRSISSFFQCIRQFDQNSWFLTLIKPHISDALYKYLYTLLEEGNLVEAFKIYVKNLKHIYHKNEHLSPQSWLFQDTVRRLRKQDKKFIFINLDNRDEVVFFQELVQEKLPMNNLTDPHHTKILRDFLDSHEPYKKIIQKVFHEDDEFFRRNI